MQNLVHAWLIRVERFSAEVDRKRAILDELQKNTLFLYGLNEEEERLLASCCQIC